VTDYRHNFLPGGSYFFTVNLAERRLALLAERIDLLRAAFRRVRAWHPFTIDAAVILPDHLIWTWPEGDPDSPLRWRLIKSAFSHRLPGGERISASRAAKGERGIWQRRYWEHTLRDGNDLQRHLDYIHFNPAKPGMRSVRGIGRIPLSPLGQTRCLYPLDWAEDPGGETIGWGER
jgi:putative transposase